MRTLGPKFARGLNLLAKSQQFGTAPWGVSGPEIAVTQDTTVAPDGTTTADTVTTSNNTHALFQNFTVVPNTQYTFSFWVLRGTMSALKYSIRDQTGGADIVAATSYYASTNGSTFTRLSFTFTTPTGCVTARVYPLRDSVSTGTVFLWGAQVNPGSTATAYRATA